VEISYPKDTKSVSIQNTLHLDLEEIIIPVTHYESVFDILTNIPQFFEPSINGNFISIFNKYINKNEGQSKESFNTCGGKNSIFLEENRVSYFSARVYNVIDDLGETITNPHNCHYSTVNLSSKGNFNFAQPEPVHVYMDITKPNLVGDPYVRLLTSVRFPSDTGYHRFDNPFYQPR